MSTLTFVAIMVAVVTGVISTLVLMAAVIRREVEELRFRRELREAAQAEADYRKVDRSLKAHGRRRHSQAVCPFPARRGGER